MKQTKIERASDRRHPAHYYHAIHFSNGAYTYVYAIDANHAIRIYERDCAKMKLDIKPIVNVIKDSSVTTIFPYVWEVQNDDGSWSDIPLE